MFHAGPAQPVNGKPRLSEVRLPTQKHGRTNGNQDWILVMWQSDLPFSEYLELWLDTIKGTVAPRTLYGYEAYIRRYALKPLAKLPLSKIKTHHIQGVYDSIQLSSSTVHTLKAALNVYFNYAIKQESSEMFTSRLC